jgi:GrpB protein
VDSCHLLPHGQFGKEERPVERLARIMGWHLELLARDLHASRVPAAARAAGVRVPGGQPRADQAVLPGTARPSADPCACAPGGSFSEQWALLFRDYLRAHAEVAAEYAAVKRRLALRFRDDRRAYVDAKGPLLWEIIRKADQSAQAQGWLPGPSDA